MSEKEKLLEIQDLVKDYGNGPVLDKVSLDVYKGDVIVLIGPSGCGKSTLLRCINGLEEIQSGKILLDGKEITGKKANWREVRQKIGMVFQSYDLFPHMTVLDNVILGPVKAQKRNKQEAIKEAEQLLDRVGLLNKKDSYPRQLSGGQKQRVAIAGIIAMKPKCIIFDEATAMLDPSGRKEVMKTIKRLNKEENITTLHITHFMEEAVDADRVIVMEKGKKLLEGTPKEVFSKIDTLKNIGLDVPCMTELSNLLKSEGLDIRDDILTVDEMGMELCQL